MSTITLPLLLTIFLSYLWSESLVPSRDLELLTLNPHARRWTRKNLGRPRRRTSFTQFPAIFADFCDVGRVTIDVLPDVTLLNVSDFYLYEDVFNLMDAWHTLVHVCQKWRSVILGSPHRLRLRIICSARTSLKKTLAIWPPLPLYIREYDTAQSKTWITSLWHSSIIIAYMESISGVLQLAVGKRLGGDGSPIPGADNSVP